MKLRSLRSPQPTAALFGKLPCALDFVRVQHDSVESIALDRWLQSASQRLTARGLHWPSAPLCFACAAGPEHSLVGIAGGSCDRAGRRFPVAIYARVPRSPGSRFGTAALVLASERFIERARGLLARSEELQLAEVRLRLRRLFAPHLSELQAAEKRLGAELAACSLHAFAAPLFAQAPERSVWSALSQLRSRRSQAGTAVDCFDCPVRSARDVAVWAHWLERTQGQAAAALWNLSARERALLAAGPLPERAPLFWASSDKSHPQLCEIGCDSTASPAADGGQSLAAVFEQLATEPVRHRTSSC